ncbi:hypothetical protein D3C85_1230590 [compost metagenome]
MTAGGAASGCACAGSSQASSHSAGSVAPPSMAQPAAQQCGKAPLCCPAPCFAPSMSSVTTRGPLAVQMMVVALALPATARGAARAEDAINA